MKQQEDYMREALKLARKAQDCGEVPIGCVIVYEGKIVGKGYNRRNTDKSTLAHAELTAIHRASRALGDWRLEGCISVCNLGTVPDVRRGDCAGKNRRSRHWHDESQGRVRRFYFEYTGHAGV